MKCATLTAYPTALPSEPKDLTDRLLQRDDVPAAAPAARRRRKQPLANTTEPATRPAPATPTPSASGLETALAATDSATEALRQAARAAPARYNVALHYRLDALAQHLQQVKEFVANLAER